MNFPFTLPHRALGGVPQGIIELTAPRELPNCAKIQDISRDGTLIHLFDLRDMEKIWKNGVKTGSAIRITDEPVGNIIKVTLDDVVTASEKLFGFPYGHLIDGTLGDNVPDFLTGSLISLEDLPFAITRLQTSSDRNKLEIAALKMLIEKCAAQGLVEKSDIALAEYGYLLAFAEHSITWSSGLIIDPASAVPSEEHGFLDFDNMPNEYKIQPAQSWNIQGIVLKADALFDFVRDRMIAAAEGDVNKMVPIYFTDGRLAWAKTL